MCDIINNAVRHVKQCLIEDGYIAPFSAIHTAGGPFLIEIQSDSETGKIETARIIRMAAQILQSRRVITIFDAYLRIPADGERITAVVIADSQPEGITVYALPYYKTKDGYKFDPLLKYGEGIETQTIWHFFGEPLDKMPEYHIGQQTKQSYN